MARLDSSVVQSDSSTERRLLEKLDQVLDGHSRVIENRAKSADAERLMIGNDNPSGGLDSAQNNVAASLSLHYETNLLKGAD
jgi:hypothetical protein